MSDDPGKMSGKEFRKYARDLEAKRKSQDARAQQKRDEAMDDAFMRDAKDFFGGTGWDSNLGKYAASNADRDAIKAADRAIAAAKKNPRKSRKAKRLAKKAAPAVKRAKKAKSKSSCAVVALLLLGALGAGAWGVVEGAVHIVQAL